MTLSKPCSSTMVPLPQSSNILPAISRLPLSRLGVSAAGGPSPTILTLPGLSVNNPCSQSIPGAKGFLSLPMPGVLPCGPYSACHAALLSSTCLAFCDLSIGSLSLGSSLRISRNFLRSPLSA